MERRLQAFSGRAGTVADPFTVVKDISSARAGLTFGPDGRLYVAQAGAGGASGKITEIRDPWLANPVAQDLLTGLISTADEGEFASVAGLSAIGNGIDLRRHGAIERGHRGSLRDWVTCSR